MLILFDIDGTLLLTQRAGMRAMLAAAQELFGDHVSFDGVEFAGRLDPLIFTDMARRHAIDPDAAHDRFRAAYLRHLQRSFAEKPTAELLPGVRELIGEMATHDDITLGLLTGNYPETGRLKIETAGLDPEAFPVAAWGIDAPERNDLPPVAMRRYADLHGRAIAAERVIVIGDTVHDVRCAKAHGCRALAVGTGPSYELAQLVAEGPGLAVNDLSDTAAVMAWVLDGQPSTLR